MKITSTLNQDTVERVIMNNESGAIGLGIAVHFSEKYHAHKLEKLAGYEISISPADPDGWLIYSGENEGRGPWIFVSNDYIKDKIEVLGPL